jgi:hypothetical protein
MSLRHSPIMTSSGLILNLDAGNSKSLTNPNRNLLAYPEDFASWTNANVSVITNVVRSPDGTFTTDKVIPNTVSTQHGVSQSITKPAEQLYYTYSVYAKDSGYGTMTFWVFGSLGYASRLDVTYTLSGNGTASSPLVTNVTPIANPFSNVTASILSVGDGWFRCSVTFRSDNSSVLGVTLYPLSNAVLVGDGTSGIYLWGSLLEPGITMSEYFPLSSNKLSTTWNDISGAVSNSVYKNLTQVELLVVGGGGGAGSDVGGGGGAGGLIYNPAFLTTPGTTYPVTVGAGGAAGGPGANGGNSVFGILTAFGGGGGSYYYDCVGRDGGSGGGGNPTSPNSYRTDGLRRGGLAVSGQGLPGSGAGGGFGGVGGSGAGGIGTPQDNNGSNGGNGLYFPQFAAVGGFPSGWFAGGGGAGSSAASSIGLGGLGGGGMGDGRNANSPSVFQNGIPNTGGGGGGDGGWTKPGNGGSGIVVVRYPAPQRASGGTVTVVNDFVYHTFTSGSGSFIVNSYSDTPRLFNNPTYDSTTSSLMFNSASNNYVDCGNSINFDNDFTVSIVVKSSAFTVEQGILTKTDAGGYSTARGFSITNISNPQTVYVWFSNGTSVNVFNTSLSSYNWTELCVSKNAAGYSVYINGIQQGSTQSLVGFGSINGSQNLFLGKGNTSAWTGQIGNLKIYNRMLSSTEILQNFNATRGRYGI